METCMKPSSSSFSVVHAYYRGLIADLSAIFPTYADRIKDDIMPFLGDVPNMIRCFAVLGKNFETALITGAPLVWDRNVFGSDSEGLPLFLRPLFHELFHNDGLPLYRFDGDRMAIIDAEGDVTLSLEKVQALGRILGDVVISLRAILLAFSKAEDLACIKSEDEELAEFKDRITHRREISTPRGVLQCCRKSLRFLGDGPEGLHPSLAQWVSQPYGAHGPGAVYDGSIGSEKFRLSRLVGGIDRITDDHTGYGSLGDPHVDVEPHSRVCIVPKDFRGHRIICIECKEAMFAQQGLWRVLQFVVEDRRSVTSQSISFRDQAPSQRLCQSLQFTTVDLKDASDYVSVDIARLLFPREFFKLITRFRSRSVEFPDGECVSQYDTLFTMGNALCFPIETLVFYALASGTLQYYFGLSVEEAASKIRVFGDDLIVPTQYAHRVTEVLSQSGMVVNLSKYCKDTLVRESCGAWMFAGIDCRMQKIKFTEPGSIRDWIALIDTARNLNNDGFSLAALELCKVAESIYCVPYGFFGLPGPKNPTVKKSFRYSVQLQRMEFLMPSLKVGTVSHLNGYVGLYSYFTGRGSQVVDHGSSDSKIVWSWVGLTS